MDGRVLTLLLTYALPAVLIAVTIWRFSANPLAILALILTMIGGSVYLLTYTDSFGGSSPG
jgi:hypothetical protein